MTNPSEIRAAELAVIKAAYEFVEGTLLDISDSILASDLKDALDRLKEARGKA